MASTFIFKDFVNDAPHLDGYDPKNFRRVSKSPPPVAKGMRSMTGPRAEKLNEIAVAAAEAANERQRSKADSELHMPVIEIVDTWSLTAPREDEPRSSGDARHHGHGVSNEVLQLTLDALCPRN